MRMSRHLGLFGNKLPTFAELFGSLADFVHAGQAFTSSSGETPSISGVATVVGDDVWFSFYCVGASMEISRWQKVSGTLTKTRLGTWYPSDFSGYTTSIDGQGTGLVGDQSVHGYHISFIKPSYDADIVEQMIRRASIGTIHYDYVTEASTWASANGALRVARSDITSHRGVYYTAFVDVRTDNTTNDVWGVGNTQNPTAVPIVGQVGANTISASILREFTSSVDGITYDCPAATVSDGGSQNARVKSYTLKYLTENW